MTEFRAKIKAKNQKAASSSPKYPMPYKVKKAKKGKIMEKPKNPYVANKVVDKIVKSKKYPYVKRAMNPKSPTINKNETLQTKGADGILFPTIRMNKRGRLKKYGDKQAMKIAKQKKDAIAITDIAPTYVSTKDVSLALSKRIGKSRGAPPKKGPTPQGLQKNLGGIIKPIIKYAAKKLKKNKVDIGKKEYALEDVDTRGLPKMYVTDQIKSKEKLKNIPKALKKELKQYYRQEKKLKKFKIGALSNLGCPHRENGVQGSDIKGVKPIQTTGKKFIGVK